MLVVKITSLLANQMFAYAAVKTLALDKGYEFKYIKEKIDPGMGSYHTKDKKYGRDFDTIFNIPSDEEISSLPYGVNDYHYERKYKKKSNFYTEFYEVKDNTLMIGHFISPLFFEHRMSEVKNWFVFPMEIQNKVLKEFSEYKKNNEILVSVHFRVGKDYRNYGYLLDEKYWFDAAKRIINILGESVKFIVLYDRKVKTIERFVHEFPCVVCHGSLVDDLCRMSNCDAHILSNSSYSIMGALLNKSTPACVIRPSIYPIAHNKLQPESFLEQWEVVNARRDIKGYLCSLFRIGKIRNKFINLERKIVNRMNIESSTTIEK